MTEDRASNEPIEPSDTERDTPSIDDAPTSIDDAPTGGDATTEDQLEADNPAEADTLKTLDPDDAPA
jgi:hypothetical protein